MDHLVVYPIWYSTKIVQTISEGIGFLHFQNLQKQFQNLQNLHSETLDLLHIWVGGGIFVFMKTNQHTI